MNKKNLGRGLAFLLVLTLLLAGCAVNKNDNTTVGDTTTVPNDTTEAENTGAPQQESVELISLSFSENDENRRYLMAYPNEDGTAYVEYSGDVKKVGTNMDIGVLNTIVDTLMNAGLESLNGQSVYEDGTAMASVYVAYSDGHSLSAEYSGTIPQAYTDFYAVAEECFREITADLAEYVPMPMVAEDVDADAKKELLEIMMQSGLENLDAYQIYNIPMDDNFTHATGLPSTEGVETGSGCSAMISTNPYSVVIVKVENESNAAQVQQAFADNLNWQKWICVTPTDALVARKGNLVLCLMGAEDLYQKTATAVKACGWENTEEIPFPGV